MTYTEFFVFRSPVTDGRRRQRAYVFVHELAHMWFGDLVTMRWWEDLWLNEMFATYLGYRTLTDATRHSTAWTDFALGGKAWGYRQDELPTTHPVSADVPDTAAALLNFDGISYSKGAAVIKQLAAWVGGNSFESGLRQYIADHAYGTTSLRDLLGAMEVASGRSLGPWAAEWLQTAGIATLRPELKIGPDGRYTAAAILQTAPAEHPTLRSQRIAIGLFELDGERLVRRDRLELDVEGARTSIPALVGRPAPHLLLLNDEDLTWAKVRLDERSLGSVRGGAIPRIDEPLARALLWTMVLDMTRDAELGVADCLRIVLDGVAGRTGYGHRRADPVRSPRCGRSVRAAGAPDGPSHGIRGPRRRAARRGAARQRPPAPVRAGLHRLGDDGPRSRAAAGLAPRRRDPRGPRAGTRPAMGRRPATRRDGPDRVGRDRRRGGARRDDRRGRIRGDCPGRAAEPGSEGGRLERGRRRGRADARHPAGQRQRLLASRAPRPDSAIPRTLRGRHRSAVSRRRAGQRPALGRRLRLGLPDPASGWPRSWAARWSPAADSTRRWSATASATATSSRATTGSAPTTRTAAASAPVEKLSYRSAPTGPAGGRFCAARRPGGTPSELLTPRTARATIGGEPSRAGAEPGAPPPAGRAPRAPRSTRDRRRRAPLARLEAGPRTPEEAVVFVHGNPGSCDDWATLAERVGAVRARRRARPAGFGEADEPADFAYTVEGYAGSSAARSSGSASSAPTSCCTTSAARWGLRGRREPGPPRERDAGRHRAAARLQLAPARADLAHAGARRAVPGDDDARGLRGSHRGNRAGCRARSSTALRPLRPRTRRAVLKLYRATDDPARGGRRSRR